MGPSGSAPAETTVGGVGPARKVIERLAAWQRPDGGWPYLPEQGHSFTEPTCWALITLHAWDALTDEAATAGAAFLRSVQTDDGGFHCGTVNAESNWVTGPAVFALTAIERESGERDRGIDWLLGFEGVHWPDSDDVYDHDLSLRAWPWLTGCHSWTEPTCYAVLALKAVRQGAHPRVTEAIRMIRDRAMPKGGWNYGNTRVLGQELRAFPSTTGMALLALRGQPGGDDTRAGLAYLTNALPRLKSAWALGWTALAARYYGLPDVPADSLDDRIDQCLRQHLDRISESRLHELAVLALGRLPRQRLIFPDTFGAEVATTAATGN
ncbi:MAG: terpene cyclase/mutase family protein [bacterium]|nr:terpene cyclase/mutase family protein [bacterium]